MSGTAAAGASLLMPMDSLFALRNGYAATVTGGQSGTEVVVTTLADSGVGSLRSFLEDPTARWIRFTPGLSGTISLASACNAYGNKTIDGRGAAITIDNAAGLVWTGRQNVILTYVTLTNVTGSNSSVDGATFTDCDLVWLHHVSALDAHDSCFDFTSWQTGATFGGCRATVDWCRIGPNPGPHEIALGRTTGPHGNLLGNPNLSPADDPSKGLFTFHHCLWEGLRDRGPFADSAYVHVYNCADRKWGDVNGGGYAMECAPTSQMLVENCCYEPYLLGETHLVAAAGTVINPDLEAVLRRSEPGALIKSSGHYKLNGATEGLSVTSTPVNGTTTHVSNPVEVFNDAVFAPSYAYTPETAGAALLATLRAKAGNVQPALGLIAA